MKRFASLLLFILFSTSYILAQSAESEALYLEGFELFNQGKFKQALEKFKSLLQLDKEQHPDVTELHGIDSQWIAHTLYKMGKTPEALKYDRAFYELLPVDRRLLKESMSFAHNSQQASTPAMAIYWAEKCLDEEIKNFGEDHPYTYGSYCNLAQMNLMNNDLVKCRKYIARAKKAADSISTSTTAWKANPYFAEMNLESSLGNEETAVGAFENTWRLLDGDIMTAPLIYAQSLQVFANLHYNDSTEKVKAEVNRVAGILRELDAEETLMCADVIRSINGYCLNISQPSPALEISERALSLIGKNAPCYPFILCEYGRLSSIAGRPEKATQCIKDALTIQKNIYPENPEFWNEMLYFLGMCYDDLHDYQTAETSFKEALKNYRKLGSEYYPMTVQTLHKLAAIASRTNQYRQAVKYLEECMSTMRRDDNESNLDLAFIYKNMAQCYTYLDPQKAVEYYKDALRLIPNPVNFIERETVIDSRLGLISLSPQEYDLEKECNDMISNISDTSPAFFPLTHKIYMFLIPYCLGKANYSTADTYIQFYKLSAALAGVSDFSDITAAECITLVGLNEADKAWELARKEYDTTAQRYGKKSRQHMNSLYIYQVIIDRSLDMDKIEELENMGDEMLEYLVTIPKNDPYYLELALRTARCYNYTNPTKGRDILEHTLNEVPNSVLMCDYANTLSAYCTLSSSERMFGNPEKALYYARMALDKSKEKEAALLGTSYLVQLYDEIGQTFMLCSQLSDAEKMFLKAVEIGESSNINMLELALVYEHLSGLYYKMGQFFDASMFMGKRSAVSSSYNKNKGMEAANLLATLWTKYNIGMKSQCLDDIAKIEEIVADNSFLDATLPSKLKAIYHFNEGNLDLASELIDSVLSSNRSLETLSIGVRIAYASGDYDKALALSQELLQQSKDYYGENPLELTLPFRFIADAHLALGNTRESLDHYRKCFDSSVKYFDQNFLTLTSKQRADFWNSNSQFYYSFLPFTAANNDFPDEMNGLLYDAALFSNGLLLSADNSIAKIVAQSSPSIKEAYSSYIAKKELLNKANEHFNSSYQAMGSDAPNDQFDAFVKERDDLQALKEETTSIERRLMEQLRAAHPDMLSYRSISWKEVQKALSKNAVAIEYLDFPSDSLNNTIAAVIVRPGLSNPVFKVLHQYPRDKKFKIEELYTSTLLGDKLINALDDVLAGCKDIYFAPQGLLCSIGLESLPRSQSEVSSDINLYRVSSTRVLAQKREKRKNSGASLFGGLNYNTSVDSLLADAAKYPELRERAFVADNLFRAKREGDVEIPPLPGTLEEVQAIHSLLKNTGTSKKNEPVIKTGNEGTESAFKALSGKYGSLLHISTHGFFNADNIVNNPNIDAVSYEDLALEHSGLLLAGAAHRYVDEEQLPDHLDDGILKSSEIAKLNLKSVDLAVLSACETGLGAVTGDGVFGLQRGFKKAGVNSILMSLWKVDDDATCALMAEFYKNWLAGKSKHESLELAKTMVKNNPAWSDPKYWAAFILLDALN